MFKFFTRRTPKRSAVPEPIEQDPRSPIELYEDSGKNLADAPLRTQQILALAQQSHRDQQERRNAQGGARDE